MCPSFLPDLPKSRCAASPIKLSHSIPRFCAKGLQPLPLAAVVAGLARIYIIVNAIIVWQVSGQAQATLIATIALLVGILVSHGLLVIFGTLAAQVAKLAVVAQPQQTKRVWVAQRVDFHGV